VLRVTKAGIRWEIESSFEPILSQVLSSAGRVIKESPVKLVTVHAVGGTEFYVKRYRHFSVLGRPLKFFFKRSQARQEWELAQKLESLRIPIVSHMALGERWNWRGLQESILITRRFEGNPLDETQGVDPGLVLSFIKTMHEAGVLHTDLHPGNILVAPGGKEMRLVDLHGIRIQPRVTERERSLNLARLRAAWPIPVSAEVEQLALQVRRRQLRYRSKRCLKHNREFAAQRCGGLKWWVRKPFFSETARRVLDDPEEFLRSRAEIFKTGRTATVGAAEGLVLKRTHLVTPVILLKDFFRPSRAYRAYRSAYHLELTGVPTARPIAAAEKRVLRFLLRSYFLMEEIPGAVDLRDYLLAHNEPNPAIIREAARVIALMHREGFSHRDLKASNLALDGNGQIYMLDLDGLKFLGEVPDWRAAADLARLLRDMDKHHGVARGQRFLFLREYCRVRGLKRVPQSR
jgi:tRNA A-37 threonylcarbamoyl transferase component Bud32